MHLIRAASAMKIPTLAICRGIQILNVAFGGTIVQDLSADWPASLAHDDSSPRNTRSHMVTLEPDSATVRALGAEQIDVNSFHHQAVDKLGDGLRITGRSPDGVVEAVESSDPEWWALCVQWHPEDLVDEPQSPDRGIFRAFADQVSRTDA
jgi:putative glutamine amidotransferase